MDETIYRPHISARGRVDIVRFAEQIQSGEYNNHNILLLLSHETPRPSIAVNTERPAKRWQTLKTDVITDNNNIGHYIF